MTERIFPRPTWLVDPVRAGRRAGGLVVPLPRTLAAWIARRRQRLDLFELAERNDHLLADVGLSRGEALREAAKPFWVR